MLLLLSQLNIACLYVHVYDIDCYDSNYKPLLKIEYYKM